MSVAANFLGGLERPIPAYLTVTTPVNVYAATDTASTVASFSLANDTGSAVTVRVLYHNGTITRLIYKASVAANATVIVSDIPIRLYSGDAFQVEAATANAITVTPIIIRSHANDKLAAR